MEWISVIVSSIATLVGLVGGGVGIFFWQENKALKQAEVKDQLVDVELKEADEWHKLYTEQKEKCDAKSAEIRDLYTQISDLKDEKSKYKFKIQQLNWYKCCDNACDHRQPPRNFDDLKTFEEIDSDIQ